jgi:hypothetical protein
VKRRATIVAAATGLLVLVGSSVAQAGTATSVSVARDTSGCVVLLPDAAQPLTVCFFPR